MLAGTLNDFSMIDVIQLLDLGSKTGTVVIHGRRGGDRLEGCLYFFRGKIHRAELDDLPGDEAASLLSTATDGPFEFVELSSLPPRNVHLSNESVIMESVLREKGARRVLVMA